MIPFVASTSLCFINSIDEEQKPRNIAIRTNTLIIRLYDVHRWCVYHLSKNLENACPSYQHKQHYSMLCDMARSVTEMEYEHHKERLLDAVSSEAYVKQSKLCSLLRWH